MCARILSLYVDRSSRNWVVRDIDGKLWLLPRVEDCWNHRQPFEETAESELEAVPGHYRYVLGLPTSIVMRRHSQ